MKFYAIAACDYQGGIGYQGNLPWSLPGETKFFRQQTLNQTLVMGHRTYSTLPKNLLINRIFIVLTNQNRVSENPSLFYARNDSHCLKLAQQFSYQKAYVIGGESTFTLFFSKRIIHTLYLSLITGVYVSDTFFPKKYLRDACQKESFYKGQGFEVFRYIFSEG